MNIEETKKAIEVMQAFVDGKEIEFSERGPEKWDEVFLPCWDWDAYQYRIKLRPKEIWVNEYHDYSYAYSTREGAERARGSSSVIRKAALYREVIEGDGT